MFSIVVGLRDAMNVVWMVPFLLRSAQLRRFLFKSLLLNVFIFGGAQLLLSAALRVALWLFADKFGQGWDLFEQFLGMIFLFPLYVVTTLANLHFNPLILKEVVRQFYLPEHRALFWINNYWVRHSYDHQRLAAFWTGPTSFLAHFLFQEIVLACFGGINLVIFLAVPSPFHWISFVLYAWFYAFYIFDPVWQHFHWHLSSKISHMEQHWSYYLGFGIPCSLLLWYFRFFTFVAIFGMCYPLFFFLAFLAVPEKPEKYLPTSLSIFGLPLACSLGCFKVLFPAH